MSDARRSTAGARMQTCQRCDRVRHRPHRHQPDPPPRRHLHFFQDGLPVIFQNERVGERGTIFNTFKLRLCGKNCIGPQFIENETARLPTNKIDP